MPGLRVELILLMLKYSCRSYVTMKKWIGDGENERFAVILCDVFNVFSLEKYNRGEFAEMGNGWGVLRHKWES